MNLSAEELSEEPFERSLRKMAAPVNHEGSTDTADVSWNAPTVQFHIGTWCEGTPGHSWQVVSQGKSRYAKEMELYAGKCIAGTIMRLFDRPEALREVHDEWFSKTKGAYACPLPENLRPFMAE
ncbi:MAG: hypothetical protein MJ059_03525 [Lachnospiraceae bacterium]|nr:hypothetical protein [Lachnospiraceae bacterium]